jgi:hypothetical protein
MFQTVVTSQNRGLRRDLTDITRLTGNWTETLGGWRYFEAHVLKMCYPSKRAASCVVKSCSLLEVYRHFRHFIRASTISVIIEAITASKTLQNSTRLYGETIQKTAIFILAAVRTSNLNHFLRGVLRKFIDILKFIEGNMTPAIMMFLLHIVK